MHKIKDERAWVTQAVYDPVTEICIKCLWVGSLESCKSVSAKILGNNQGIHGPRPHIEFGEGKDENILTFPRRGRSRPRRRLNSNFFMEGIALYDELKSVVSGEGDYLYDQVFQVFKGNCEIPLLREWVPGLFNEALKSGSIIRLSVAGMDIKANQKPTYHIKISESAIEEILLKHLPLYAQQAAVVIKANAA